MSSTSAIHDSETKASTTPAARSFSRRRDRALGAQQVAERDPGDDEVGGECLGVERQPHERGGGQQRQPATGADRA